MVPGYQNYGQCQVGLGIGIEKAVCIIFNFKINYQTKFTSDSNIFFVHSIFSQMIILRMTLTWVLLVH